MAFKIVTLILSVFLAAQSIYGQETGIKYFKNYTYKEYDHQPQNWGALQTKNGIIYVANDGGLLEFDGVAWRVIKVPGYNHVRSIAIDETGTIYIGGINQIGYLAPGTGGNIKYVSLLDQLDDKQKNFSVVWKTCTVKKQIYFFTTPYLFRWAPQQQKLTVSPHNYSSLLNCGEKLYLRGNKTGLRQLLQMKKEGLKTQPVSGGEQFAGKRVSMITPYESNNAKQLIGTEQNGFYMHDGETTTPFTTGVDDYLKKNKLYRGIRLTTGDYALGTLLGGVVVMTPDGQLKNIFDKTSGLQDDKVHYLFEDNRGNLWLCLEKGISKIEYTTPISILDKRSQLDGLVSAVTKHREHLYVGTTKGLYTLETPFKFRLISGAYNDCLSILSAGDTILAAVSGGVLQVDENNRIIGKVLEEQAFALLASRENPAKIWCGTTRGLVLLTGKSGQWREERRIKEINQVIMRIVEDKNGNLWLGTLTGGVLKVDFIKNNQTQVTTYGTKHGLPGTETYIAAADGHVMFATGKGIFRYDTNEKRFIPDHTLGVEYADGTKPVFRIAEDKNKNIWFHSSSKNYHAIPQTNALLLNGGYTIHSEPFRRIPEVQVNVIYPDPAGGKAWFGSIDGLICYDTTINKNYAQGFKTLVRKVRANKELIFNGTKNERTNTAQNLFSIIEYKDRNLYFEFAAPFFEAEKETQYRCFLEGYGDGWSAWNKDTKRNYTNLEAGRYTFRVQAKNVYMQTGEEDTFRFTILPPWYNTWWAYLIFAAVFFLLISLLVYSLVKWRSRKLEREKQRLEQIVKERTGEIKNKNRQLEKQTITLQDQSEKLKEMDEVKSRFFANISHEFRTPLTLIMGPLEKMLTKKPDRERARELKMMLRNSQRLLRLINRLLDLSKLDSGKMKLNALFNNIVPVIKVIVSAFEALALQHRVELKLHLEEEEVILSFDPEKFEEVLCNLLVNALKFTPSGGKVTITARRGRPEGSSFPNGYLELSVRDTGIGIPRDKLGHIFDRFYQSPDTRPKNQKGFGIGLALTKELVLLHQGRIDIHSSEGTDSGTEFVIRLPLGRLNPEHTAKDRNPGTAANTINRLDIHKQYLSEEEENETFTTSETSETPSKTQQTPESQETTETTELAELTEPAGEKQRDKNIILVVEDNADVREYIRGALEPHYTVVETKNGREGVEKAAEIVPDLIVSDVMMPEMDGYELCRQLKKDIKVSHIPIILLTARASDQSVVEGLETGADDYITKPFNTRILTARIRNLIECRSHLQQKIQKEMLLQPAEIAVSSMDQEFIEELKKLIKKNLSDPEFHVVELSQKLYMNRVTLYRKIKALTGDTPTQFLRSYRLKWAAQLLKDKGISVSEVALKVGFSNFGYFSKCFKEKFHQQPSAYQASEN
ncbi:MAG: response regulator [bacterium]|nr:response regulator [bacterium]